MRIIALASFVTAMTLSGVQTILFAQDSETEPLDPSHVEFFESKIRPILLQHCYECHSAEAKNVKGGLLLDSRASSLKGGDSGPAVVPGKIDESLLISALKYEGFEMPPRGKLPEDVIADFTKWVEMGAPDPREGTIVASSIDFETAKTFWSYQPIVSSPPPTPTNSRWGHGVVDQFALAKIEEHGLQPVAAATKRELIRRATFDLIGLPPAPADVASFLADESRDAFEKVIDRLLASPHYGERWGRYWLDVARYSEDQAHTFSVTANTDGYRYRDWVIRAFNEDMPYDKFVRLQIAGDLIGPDKEGSWDHHIALGYFGLGAQYYKNSDAAKAAADELDDRVDTLTRGFLGLTVSCARCHDHKFDPIPTQDYYSLAGIFNSSRLHNAPLCSDEEVRAYNEGQQRIKTLEEDLKKFLADQNTTAAESRVGEIAQYMKAVWKFRAVNAMNKTDAKNNKITAEAFASQTGINEFLFKRWVRFLNDRKKGEVTALDAWFELEEIPAEQEISSDTNLSSDINLNVPASVETVASEFQQRIQSLLDLRDGIATANLVTVDESMPHKPGSPRFVTPLVTKLRPTAGIDVDIRDARQLFLVVSEGSNGNSCDHSDWLEPTLVGPAGELKLTELKWKSLEGFDGGRINQNYLGRKLRVGGKEYENGIGVHAPCVIVYDLPEGYERFKAVGGLDNSGSDQGGCGEQATIQFSVYTETPVDGPIGVGEDLLTKVLGKDGPFAVSSDHLEEFLSGEKRTQLVNLRNDLEEARQSAPPKYAIAHAYAEANPADMKVFVRGNPAVQREVAPRRFLKILAGDEPPLFTNGSGRKELAEAITQSDNPLTARVMVNRIWQHHFGRGIVATPSNFGSQGERPTHPELLDYLAARFIESGWSVKSVHREIMLSAVYQLSSNFNEANANVDADNRFLWKMNRRRLDVEAWRDALLDVSGRLDPTLGGPSTNLSEASNVRRTVYAMISRHELDNLLRLFDFPDANITSEKRTETTVPQQQLFVLNSPFMIEQSKAFTARLHREAPENDESRIRQAFELAYSRPPTDLELELGLAWLSGAKDKESQLSRWEQYSQILLSSNEFMYLD